jgi:hypothetical protein
MNAMYRRYLATGELTVPRRAGRKGAPPSEGDVARVLRIWEEYRLGAYSLELALEREGVHVQTSHRWGDLMAKVFCVSHESALRSLCRVIVTRNASRLAVRSIE